MIEIHYTDQFVEIFYVNSLGVKSEIGYVDKHTRMEDVAQEFYELAAVLNVSVELHNKDK